MQFDFPFKPLHKNNPIHETNFITEITIRTKNQEKTTFSIILPKDWLHDPLNNLEENEQIPFYKSISVFAPYLEPNSPFINIIQTSLTFEVDLENWVKFFIQSEHFILNKIRFWETPSKGNIIDIGAFREINDSIDVARIMSFKYNNKIYTICGISQSIEWDQYKNDFLIACASFSILNPKSTNKIEEIFNWSSKSEIIFSIPEIPKCWKFFESNQVQNPQIEFYLFENENINENIIENENYQNLQSYISIHSHPNDSNLHLNNLISNALEEILKSQITIQGTILFIPGKNQNTKVTLAQIVIAEDYQDLQTKIIDDYLGTLLFYGILEEIQVKVKIGFKLLPDTVFTIFLVSIKSNEYPKFSFRSEYLFNLIRQKISSEQIDSLQKIDENNEMKNLDYSLINEGLNALKWKLLIESKIINSKEPLKQFVDIIQPTKWILDKDVSFCMNCKSEFSVTNRKHHCRNCGLIFCSKCSSKKRPIWKYNLFSPQRVCDNCNILLDEEQQNQHQNLGNKIFTNSHDWKKWKIGSFVEFEISNEKSKRKLKNIRFTLSSQSEENYSLQKNEYIDRQMKVTKMNIQNSDENDSSQNPIYKTKIGFQILNIEKNWYKCNVWRFETEGIIRDFWIINEFDFPLKIIALDLKNGIISSKTLVNLDEEIQFKQKNLTCLKYEGKVETQNKNEMIQMIWISDKIPGSVVKIVSHFENEKFENWIISNFKGKLSKEKQNQKKKKKMKKKDL
ncbi:vacuolar protein sorting-associated protein [Anaeramoeba ignava]|uniref:Vacuolar protein sorting-associated protein n=1 Tax=Anaeramoeba ignava TaxID=1746090 RepID=A0A9Q0LB06_ANAIG|nr:vacuolar protein sorting-associated protein [Anaeramoeba ignava]